MDHGCEGGTLHGNFDNTPYFYREGKIFTGLIVVEYLLADEGPGASISASRFTALAFATHLEICRLTG